MMVPASIEATVEQVLWQVSFAYRALCTVRNQPFVNAFLMKLVKALDGLNENHPVVSDLLYIGLKTNGTLLLLNVLFQTVLNMLQLYLMYRHLLHQR